MISIQKISDQLPRHPYKRYKTRSISDIKFIVAHHSATTSGTPESFANHHVNKNNWPGIGYHYVIAKDGQVFRTNNLTTVSYHCAGVNSQSIGICMVGNFDIEEPTIEQVQAFRELVKMNHLPVYGHRDFSNKSCPGKNVNIRDLYPETSLVYSSRIDAGISLPSAWKKNLLDVFESGEGGDGAVKAKTALTWALAILLLLILVLLFTPSPTVQ